MPSFWDRTVPMPAGRATLPALPAKLHTERVRDALTTLGIAGNVRTVTIDYSRERPVIRVVRLRVDECGEKYVAGDDVAKAVEDIAIVMKAGGAP